MPSSPLATEIADLIAHIRYSERQVERVTETMLPTEFGEFTCVAFRSTIDEVEHLAFVKGDVSDGQPVLVRVMHSAYNRYDRSILLFNSTNQTKGMHLILGDRVLHRLVP